MSTNNLKPMVLPSAVRPSLQEMEPRSVRQATALDEIRTMHEDLQKMQLELTTAYRELDARGAKIEVLETALQDSRDAERLYRMKLIRLSEKMETMHSLSGEAHAIMTSVREAQLIDMEKAAAAAGDSNGRG